MYIHIYIYSYVHSHIDMNAEPGDDNMMIGNIM